MDGRRLTLGCILSILVFTVWMPADGQAEPGEGLKTDSLVLSPSLTISGAYDTNVFRQGGNEPQTSGGDPLVAPILTVNPAFTLRTRESVNLNFSLDGSVKYDEYFAPNSAAVDAQGGFSGGGGTSLTLNPKGTVSFNVHDDIEYRAEPPNMVITSRQARLYNKAGAILGFHPGDDVFRLDAGYDFELFRYYEDDRTLDLDKDQHSFTLDGKYKFLPKTAFVARGNWKLIQYESPFRQDTLPNVDSTPLRIVGGMSGLITRRFSVRLLGGYGHGMYDQQDDFQSFIGDFQLAFRLGPLDDKTKDAVFVRYERGFEDSTVTNFYAFHRGTVGYHQSVLDNRLEFDVKGSATYEDYSSILADQAADSGGIATFPGDLKDTRLLGNVGVTVNATKWLALIAEYQYDQNITDTNYDYPAPFEPTREYMRHYFKFSAKAHY